MSSVRVKRHLRRRTEAQKMTASLRKLEKLPEGPNTRRHADAHMKSVCYVAITKEDSQLLPDGGFRKGRCSVANVGPEDRGNPVSRSVTAFHESLHAEDVKRHGVKVATPQNELRAHYKTVKFIKEWQRRSKSENEQKWLAEEMASERKSIHTLKEEYGL